MIVAAEPTASVIPIFESILMSLEHIINITPSKTMVTTIAISIKVARRPPILFLLRCLEGS